MTYDELSVKLEDRCRDGRALLAPRWLEDFTCVMCEESGSASALVVAGEVAVCLGCVIALTSKAGGVADGEHGRQVFLPAHDPVGEG